jgi:transcriptional regulator with PAS, ATPase and Fis domain
MAAYDETLRVASDGRSMRILGVDLVVVEGPARGTIVRVEGNSARVGSAPGCRLVLPDRAVSRVHCELVAHANRIVVRDLGSTNGTYVGEIQITEAAVPPGTVVRCGASAFRIDCADEPGFIAISERTSFGELVGSSLEMRQVYAVLERVAPTDATVLVQGETGTGKDVVARSIHAGSPRRDGPFIPIDCGAIPEALFESELFGHVRGAFTGAHSDRAGAFEEANRGTLFLDEIGEMPVALQAKLLRAIESRCVRPVGAAREMPVDVRIICATSRRLAQMVNEGTFREDLYYRLAVVELAMPPLRARRGDIRELANHLYAKLTGSHDPLAPELLARFESRPWPGNVRELRNAIERAVALGQARPATAPQPLASAPALPSGIETIVPLHLPMKDAKHAWVNGFESIYVRAMLARTNGNVTRAAHEAGISRRFMQRLIARLGIRAADDDDET